ncbi:MULTISPECIES: hypothetical protein [unclassified Shinella]|uniref:hypothetical protein n=1 Tax=unclassified Shinella TaxID=2643062 RepID=UPI00225D1392|nr:MULTISPECIES: hypothetical protein [unclassified Shinella]MCO5138978.1 hypothetical protein [Shinella sp.]MDC7256293.1 hypothetical protein [Shinella sp. YE25]CAI0339152.1 conserved membrane hypothetical protein [Rhizobiaceae bacterium]CAK7257565.1 conserved membrane protein of unknown function [Shinella sp. WSC3-e]
MALMLYPLRYLTLQDEKTRSLGRRDAPATLLLAALIALPFTWLPDANFLGVGGFLASMSGLASALAGFYVAALVAAATLARGSDLDSPIQVGKIIRVETVEGVRERQPLSRREYVCALFGYLSFLSFGLSIGINVIVALAASKYLGQLIEVRIFDTSTVTFAQVLSPALKIALTVPIAHLFVVTTYGLYYLIKRLYEQKPKVKSPVSNEPPSAERRPRRAGDGPQRRVAQADAGVTVQFDSPSKGL